MPADPANTVTAAGRKAALAAAAGCALLAALFVARAWRQIPVGDQVFDLVSADCLARGEASEYLDLTALTYPPAYMLTVSSLMKTAGLSAVQASKAAGVLSFAAALALLCAAAARLAPGRAGTAAAVAGVLYCLSPAAIQGTQVLKQDPTLLTVSLLAFFLLFAVSCSGPAWRGLLLLGACFSLVLWSKSTTALAVPVALLAYFAAGSGPREGALKAAAVFLAGTVLFLASWYLLRRVYPEPFAAYPFFCHFDDIFREYGARMTKTLAEQAHEWLKGGLVALWFSPFLCALWLAAAWRRVGSYFEKGRPEPQDLALLLSAVILLGYGAAGGLAHGFPRYQFPALPFCVLTAALYCAEQFPGAPGGRPAWFAAGLAGVSLLAALFVTRDTVYDLYFVPRLAAAWPERSWPALIPALLRACLCVPLAAAGYFASRRFFPELTKGARHALVLAPLALGASLGQDILQYRAPYLTAYTYGGSGISETIALLAAEAAQGRKVVAPDDIVYHIPGARLDRRADDWVRPEALIGQVRLRDADIVAYGLPSNSVAQYRAAFNVPETTAFLEGRFAARTELGSYTVWAKRRYEKN